MKLINVIPITKIPLPLPQTLSYFSSAKNLKIGSLVSVPIGKRKAPGIVIGQKNIEDEKINIKKAGYRLRPIDRIINIDPVISKSQLALALWMHEYYYEPLGLILKSILPKNINENYPPKADPPWAGKSPSFAKASEGKQNTKLLISNIENSIDYFKKEIQKVVKVKKQALILAPDINTLDNLQKNITTPVIARTPRLWRGGQSNPIAIQRPVRGSLRSREIASVAKLPRNDNIVIVTSKMTPKKMQEIREKVSKGEIKIIIGTRKAFFMPFQNLGLVILAEEHNSNYKSWGQHPKYHAREATMKLAELHNAKMIMQSEAPNIETEFKNQKSKIKIAHQKAKLRYDSIIIDMREEIKNGNYSIFSDALLERIKKGLKNNKKIALFINRRGESTVVMCRDCGNIIKCKNCEIPLVQHSSILICHHCNYKEKMPNLCPKCNGHRIKFFGTGTQKVEKELQKIFPKLKTLRIDSDMVKTEKDKKNIVEEFNKKNAILIGTQLMNAVELPKLDLIGIVNIETMLNMPDFHSGEKTFQTIKALLKKLKNRGKIIIQTYSPDNYAIKYGIENNYDKFYQEEIKIRKLFKYPPFSQIVKLTFADKNKAAAETEAKRLHTKLTNVIASRTQVERSNPAGEAIATTRDNTTRLPRRPSMKSGLLAMTTNNQQLATIIGPAPAFIPRKKVQYVWNIILKLKTYNLKLKTDLLRLVPSNWEVEVDPESLL